ncbi:MAG: ABC transporter permease subunit [Gorillibacterium sp.]|nr:ABC transporter permease subunit [Gorillibacterium sp.]
MGPVRVAVPVQTVKPKWNHLIKEIKKNKYLYFLLFPGLAFYIIFNYVPMYGITLAFKTFMFNKGIVGSPWSGFDNFSYLFVEADFWVAVKNTLIISFGKILFGFPAPIILALLINELWDGKLKKNLQTIYTFPNFLSWIIVSGFVVNLASDTGMINNLIHVLGFEKQAFLADSALFRPLLYVSDIWKSAGWSCIIYLAAIASIDPSLYESAEIDGASRIQKILSITLPNIRPTAVLLLLLSVGNVMNAGFDQVFNLYNPMVYNVGDIIDTYLYRITFQAPPEFGVSVAVGLFKACINFLLLVIADRMAKLMGSRGIF